MKYVFLSMISALLVSASIAQTSYETPHVKNGKTMKFEILPDFFLVENTGYYGNAMYSKDKDIDAEEIDFNNSELAYIAVSHESAKDNAMLQFLEELIEEMDEDFQPGYKTIDQPHIELVNGKECLMAAVSGVESKIKMDAFYINALEFGDYMIVFYYLSNSENATDLSYEDFKKIAASGIEIATTKKDVFAEFDDEIIEDFDAKAEPIDPPTIEDELEEIGFKNDLFETGFTYFDVLPETGENWDDALEENAHLLSEFVYKENNGSLKVFSGGDFTNYPSTDEMSSAIKKILERSTRLEIRADSEFANEEHVFKLYSISGAGTVRSFYTTVAEDELFFFLVDGGLNESADFKEAVRDFMLTMWIASW